MDAVHGWVSRHIPPGPRPPIVRPVNYTRIVVVSTIILGLLSVLRVAWPFFVPIIRNRNIWAAASLILILMFTSGHMFNHIRKVPYVVGDGKGGVSYFAGGFSNQFGLETQIVAAMCEFINRSQVFSIYILIAIYHRRCSFFRYHFLGP